MYTKSHLLVLESMQHVAIEKNHIYPLGENLYIAPLFVLFWPVIFQKEIIGLIVLCRVFASSCNYFKTVPREK